MMPHRPRLYDSVLQAHFRDHRQMAFVTGPRQVGKTTTCGKVAINSILNWDNSDHRRLILAGPAAIAGHFELDRLRKEPRIICFDELHKCGKWKSLLKGFFDTQSANARILVTGSSRLDVFRRGGDSLMGRYFLFRMHPFSVGELIRTGTPDSPVCAPETLMESEWEALWTHGGYPEPFIQRNTRFQNRWQQLRWHQLIREDVRDLTRLQELGQLEVLARLLGERSGCQISYTQLAQEVQVSVDTVRRWISLLSSLHFGFLIRPWFNNVAKSLRKEPKWFLRDWSMISDIGAKAETFVACHLLKCVQGWQDLGFGQFELCYLRDKQKREVDFIVIKNRKPWFLVEVKHSDTRLSPSLEYFQKQTGAEHAFQVVMTLDYEQADCFQSKHPIIVPARTLLSQWL